MGRTREVAAKRGAARREKAQAGLWSALRGAANPRWRGGKEARLARIKESGMRAEWTRRYRKKYPEKIREFTQRRHGRKLARLPRGTVKRIGEAQRWMCPICRTSIRKEFHVDHIMPLAKGGSHEPSNLQLLCPQCNLRKNAKHPVDFMQSKGFLL
jgi:5-methylcytosine-specific restriction endonuclease McrA